MPEYKVFYFNVKALGEPLRFLLSYGNLPFEDVRISRNDWPALKPSMPMNQLPCLEVNGKKVNQSLACCRFIAKDIKLAGNDDWENLQIDTVADTVNDFRLKIAVVSYEPDDEVKEKKLVTLNNEVIPFYLEKLDDIARENGGYLSLGRVYTVLIITLQPLLIFGKFLFQLTWADFYFAGIIDYLNYLAKQDLTANHENLRKVVDNVIGQSAVQDWINNRPHTDI